MGLARRHFAVWGQDPQFPRLSECRFASLGSQWHFSDERFSERLQKSLITTTTPTTSDPVTSYSKLNNFFNENPADFTEDVSSTHLGSDSANYNLTERVTAGYIMNTLRSGRWSLQTGLRLEATQLDILGYNVTNDINGNWTGTTPVKTSQWYVDPLPSVQLRYQITSESDIRAVYGRGLSRPNPYDLVPYSTVDQSTNPYTISVGNPNLKAEHANDFDILYEHYLQPYGVIQGGFFYKQLIDPIYYTTSLDTS